MHFIFLTRCSTLTNLPLIKKNLKNVFSKQEQHTYQHVIIVDLFKLKHEQYFYSLKDQKTFLYFVHNKPYNDKYITNGVDQSIANINKEAYCYMLDDDNLINYNFLDICTDINYETDDVVIFRTVGYDHLGLKNNILNGKIISFIDWGSFLTKLSIAQKLKFYNGIDSQRADGYFITKVVQSNCNIKFSEQVIANYNLLHVY